jgi:predicted nucleic acid-binding protein
MTPPAWAEVRSPKDTTRFSELGPGEREAISLALETKADFLLIDETAGRKTAVHNGVAVKGTLGILEDAANRNLVDFTQAVSKLRVTRIFLSEDIVQDALKRHRDRQQEQHHGLQQNPEQDHGIER